MQQNGNTKAYFTLISGLIFMSFSAVLFKASHAPGIVTAFYRMCIGTAILTVPFLIHLLKNNPNISLRGLFLAISAGICFGFDLSFWSTGVVTSNATIPTIFANMAPVWVGIGSIFIFKDKLSRGFWQGLGLAVLGILMVLYRDLNISNGIVKGALLGSAAGFFYGAFYLFAQKGRKLLDTLSFLYISTFSSTILLLFLTQAYKYSLTDYDQHTWYMFITLGMGVQVFGWMLISYSQGYLPASIVSPTLLGQPVFTAILAILLLDEILTWLHITGGLVVIAGIYIVHFSQYKKSK